MDHHYKAAGRLVPETKREPYPFGRLFAGYYSTLSLVIPIIFLFINGSGFRDGLTYSWIATVIGFWISFTINITFAIYLTYGFKEYFDAPHRLKATLVGGVILSFILFLLQILCILPWLGF